MSAAVDVVERLLLEAVDRKTSQPAEALHAISTAITSSQTAKWHFQRKVSSLCPAAAAALRSLVYQALHGLAPERLRDQSMAALATIICPDSSFIDHLWTIEKHEMSSTATGSKLGGFAMFLCSILRGEVHLLREELECYYQVIVILRKKYVPINLLPCAGRGGARRRAEEQGWSARTSAEYGGGDMSASRTRVRAPCRAGTFDSRSKL